MLQLPGKPAPQYFDSAVQKVELDIHACDVRWSKGTRLFLDYSPTLETGDDIASFFPDFCKLVLVLILINFVRSIILNSNSSLSEWNSKRYHFKEARLGYLFLAIK
jgi:hypothetical protein